VTITLLSPVALVSGWRGGTSNLQLILVLGYGRCASTYEFAEAVVRRLEEQEVIG
jgi:hypothetical protein